MTFEQRVKAIIDDVKYRDWNIVVAHFGGISILHLEWTDKCVISGLNDIQVSRPWLISEDQSDDAILNTIFKAIMCAEEHETKERFTYKGKRVFNPHIEIKDLMRICE
jgi:hypothetical protein